MSRKKITIGLFGFGCVGSGLHEVLKLTPGIKADIKKICVKDKSKERSINQSYFTYDKNEILNDDEINVVVELIDNSDEAYDIVTTALKNGKAVVSANKKMIAEHFEELVHLQRQYNVPLLYEAACCASIPIIRNLEEYYDNDLLESIEGIVNGSTNYILSKIASKNMSFDIALQKAQQLGYAESNPILDVGGYDAKYKLLILLAHAFGIILKPEDILNIGIDKIGTLEANYAKEKGYKIKLVANAYRDVNGSITGFVIPKYVNNSSRLYNVDDVYNGVITHTGFADNQFFMGKGAGSHATASAVLSDISALSYDYKYEYKKLGLVNQIQNEEETELNVLLRFPADKSEYYKKQFIELKETYANNNAAYIIGKTTLGIIRTLSNNPEVSIILHDYSAN